MISDAFEGWSEHSIKTTTETRDISEIRFPVVTVCPQNNIFTHLNHDLMNLDNLTMTDETKHKQQFLDIANKVFLDSYFENEVLANIRKLEEENRFYNWYHGYTQIRMTFWDGDFYFIYTSATTGNIKTQYFGDKYDPDKIERKLWYKIRIYPPAHVVKNLNFTLTLEIEKVNMKVSGDSYDDMTVEEEIFDPDQNNLVLDFTAPDEYIYIRLWRNVNSKEIETNINLETMPGFSIKWSYNEDVKPDAKYINETMTSKYKRQI